MSDKNNLNQMQETAEETVVALEAAPKSPKFDLDGLRKKTKQFKIMYLT